MASAPIHTAAPVTAEQLSELPDDGTRHELVEGELRTMTPAGGSHGLVGATLLGRMYTVVAAGSLGRLFTAETGFMLRRDPDTVRAPDVAFVRAERVPEARVPGFPALAPDLVAEIVSPYDRAVDVSGKALAWLDAGVRLVWVVDPENRTVTVHRPGGTTVLRGRDELSGEDVIEGLALPLDDLWA